MTRIELDEGYYIDTDAMNYTLKRKQIRKADDGSEREVEKVIGHYGTFIRAIRAAAEVSATEKTEGMCLKVDEYLEGLNAAVKKACEALTEKKEGRTSEE